MGLKEATITIEFTIQSFGEGSEIVALRSMVDGCHMPLTHPSREILWAFAERFRVVDTQTSKYLHIESAVPTAVPLSEYLNSDRSREPD